METLIFEACHCLPALHRAGLQVATRTVVVEVLREGAALGRRLSGGSSGSGPALESPGSGYNALPSQARLQSALTGIRSSTPAARMNAYLFFLHVSVHLHFSDRPCMGISCTAGTRHPNSLDLKTLKIGQRAGAAAAALHGRQRCQGYEGHGMPLAPLECLFAHLPPDLCRRCALSWAWTRGKWPARRIRGGSARQAPGARRAAEEGAFPPSQGWAARGPPR